MPDSTRKARARKDTERVKKINQYFPLSSSLVDEAALEDLIALTKALHPVQGNSGDKIATPLGAIHNRALGFMLARRLGFWRSCIPFVATEVLLLLWIRDSLLLEVAMMIDLIVTIKVWQMAP
jgi:hypothetical protein